MVGCAHAPPTPEVDSKVSKLAPLPKTERQEQVDTLHGVAVQDPYRWLEDVESPKVQAWMQARDTHARAHLGGLKDRDALFSRYKQLLYVESRSAPKKKGDRLFFEVKPADQEKSIYYWQAEGGEPKVLLDPNTMSADGSVSVHAVIPSPDGRKVAYMEQANNADESTLRVLSVDSGEVSTIDTIEHLRYTRPSWTPKADGFYYTWLPSDPKIASTERMAFAEVRYHALGTAASKDKTVRAKTGDATRWQGAELSEDGRFLVLTISRGWSEQDVYIMQPGDKDAAWAPLAVGTKSNYQVIAHEGVLYVATNHEAPRWKVFRVEAGKLQREHWTQIIAEDDSAVLEHMTVVGGKLGLTYLHNASSKLMLHKLDGTLERQVKLPTLGTSSGLTGAAKDDVAYFTFSSFNYPTKIYQTSITNGETSLFAEVKVPVKSEDFVVEQVFYPSKDGTKVSMFLVYDKKLQDAQGSLSKTGEHPVMMFAYGGFNIPLTPSFSAWIIPWLERGGVYAMPNLRGGGEYGEAWHQAGMLGNKQNVFDDHQAAVRWLQTSGYTRPGRTVVRGRSNGGLLMGAAMTQAPELFAAVICGVPLLDMLRYHLFGVGRAWIPEYGSAEDPEQFGWLHAYSPYHQVKAGVEYPAMLMLSADTDDRVDPMHARKFVAAIEHANAGGAVNLLRIEKNSGHGGSDMRTSYAARMADMVAFALDQTR